MNNIIQMWFFLELTSISSFLLIATGPKPEAAKGTYGIGYYRRWQSLLLAGLVLIAVIGQLQLDVILQRPGDQVIVGIRLFLRCCRGVANLRSFLSLLVAACDGGTNASQRHFHSATMVKAGIFLLARFYPALGTSMVHYCWRNRPDNLVSRYRFIQTRLKGLVGILDHQSLGVTTLPCGCSWR